MRKFLINKGVEAASIKLVRSEYKKRFIRFMLKYQELAQSVLTVELIQLKI